MLKLLKAIVDSSELQDQTVLHFIFDVFQACFLLHDCFLFFPFLPLVKLESTFSSSFVGAVYSWKDWSHMTNYKSRLGFLWDSKLAFCLKFMNTLSTKIEKCFKFSLLGQISWHCSFSHNIVLNIHFYMLNSFYRSSPDKIPNLTVLIHLDHTRNCFIHPWDKSTMKW